MRKLARILTRYAVAVTTVGLALVLTVSLPPLRQLNPSTLFFAAIMVSSWYGGIGPGLLATALSAWSVDYFIVPPAFSLAMGLDDVVRIGVFIAVAVLINYLNLVRKRLEASLRERAEQLAAAHGQKDLFLAKVVHDLRNPLAAIANASQVLRLRGGGDPAVARAGEVVERQGRRLARLVEDLLDLSRISQGKVVLRKETVEAAAMVAHAVETVRPIVDERNHRLEIVLPAEQVLLEADPDRLEQVLVNLIANAAKYTEPGGRICLTVSRAQHDVVLRVADTGIGLSATLLPRIFEPFVQGESGSRGGLGIGLNLVRGLVELHGGSVTALSAGPGRGSEFVVRLPVPAELPQQERATPAVVS